MLLKLIKYDFKATYIKMLSAFALYFILAVAVPFIIYPFNKDAASIYITFITMIGTFAFAAVITIFIFQHFNSNIYGKEGYLMSTLPTNGYMLLLSKFITAFIWNFIAFIIEILSFASLLTLYYWTIPQVADIVNAAVASSIFGQIIGYALQLFFAITLSSIVFYMSICLSIAISKLSIFGKFGALMGVVSFFVISFIENIPLDLIQSAMGKGTTYAINSTTSIDQIMSALTHNGIFNLMWYDTLVDVAFGILFFFITGWLIDKKLSLK